MRGRTWQFNVNQIAGQIAAANPKDSGPDGQPAAIAVRAADIADAVYAEKNKRNASAAIDRLRHIKHVFRRWR